MKVIGHCKQLLIAEDLYRLFSWLILSFNIKSKIHVFHIFNNFEKGLFLVLGVIDRVGRPDPQSRPKSGRDRENFPEVVVVVNKFQLCI